MDSNTELLLKISTALGGLSADMNTLKESFVSFREEIAEMKKNFRDHEGLHIELAPKKDVDELWVQIRKADKRLSVLETAPAKSALERDKKIKEQLLSIAVGILGVAGISALIYAIADNIIRGVKP